MITIHVLQEILLVLDGTTGLNMLQQAREFNDVMTAPDNLELNFIIFALRGLVLVVMLYCLGLLPGCWSYRIHPD
jgi:hypothetical protein